MELIFKHAVLGELFSITRRAPAEDNTATPDVYSAFGGRVVFTNYFGNISLAGMDNFKPALFDTLTGDAQQIIIGLGQVSDFSRSALGALVDFASAVLGRGKKLYLLSPPEGLRQSLKELQLTMFFEVLQDEDDLLRILPDE